MASSFSQEADTCLKSALRRWNWWKKSVIARSRGLPRWFSGLARFQLFAIRLPSGVVAFVSKITFAYNCLQTPEVQPGLVILGKS